MSEKPKGKYLELNRRVRLILVDLFEMDQSDVQKFIDELKEAGIGFREVDE